MAAIISLCKKAYTDCSSKFHNYFENEFVRTFLVNSVKRDKHIISKSNRDILYNFIDSCVLYRLELTNERPDKSNLLYSFANPFDANDSLDDLLESLVYGMYPATLVKEFKDSLEQRISDERIVDLMVTKLEVKHE